MVPRTDKHLIGSPQIISFMLHFLHSLMHYLTFQTLNFFLIYHISSYFFIFVLVNLILYFYSRNYYFSYLNYKILNSFNIPVRFIIFIYTKSFFYYAFFLFLILTFLLPKNELFCHRCTINCFARENIKLFYFDVIKFLNLLNAFNCLTYAM